MEADRGSQGARTCGTDRADIGEAEHADAATVAVDGDACRTEYVLSGSDAQRATRIDGDRAGAKDVATGAGGVAAVQGGKDTPIHRDRTAVSGAGRGTRGAADTTGKNEGADAHLSERTAAGLQATLDNDVVLLNVEGRSTIKGHVAKEVRLLAIEGVEADHNRGARTKGADGDAIEGLASDVVLVKGCIAVDHRVHREEGIGGVELEDATVQGHCRVVGDRIDRVQRHRTAEGELIAEEQVADRIHGDGTRKQ